jgi:fatty acid-binding protein DegV
MDALTTLVRDVRPQAEIEVATTLGPVLGTHAGPGTVGLFWLEDELV